MADPDPREAAALELQRRGKLTDRAAAAFDELQRRRAANAPVAPIAPTQPVAPERAAILQSQARDRERLSQREAVENITFDETRGFEPGIDYETGAGMGAKTRVQRSDNEDEARAGLEDMFGKGKIGQDKGGRWWAEIDGKKVDVMGGGKSLGRLANRATSGIVATLPELTGAGTGALAGLPAGPVGAIGGAIIGGGGGKGLDELTKAWQGFYRKKPAKEAEALATAGAAAGVGQAAGPVLKATGRGLKSVLDQLVFETTPESNAMVRNLLNQDGRPPLETIAPGWKAMQAKQQLRNVVKGDPQMEKNIELSNRRLRDVLGLSGMSQAEQDEAYNMLIDPRRAVSTTGEARTVVRGVKDHVDLLEREAAATMDTAKRILATQDADLAVNTRTMPANAQPHKDFAEAVQLKRREFGRTIGRLYDDVHEMAGEAQIVATDGLKASVKDIVEALPKDGKPNIFREISELPEAITLKDAQRFRTRLREESDSGTLTPGTVHHDYGQMAKAFDSALDPNAMGAMAPEALKLLKQADGLYRQGIRKFDDAKLNQMVNDAKSGKVLDPEKFAASLFDTESTARIANFADLVGPTVWKDVQTSYASNLWRRATKLAKEGTQSREVSGRSLVDTLAEQGTRLDSVFGRQTANEMRQYADRLAAINGSIDPKALQTGQFRTALETSLAKQEQLREFVSSDVLRAFAKGGPKEVDTAIDVLLAPGKTEQLRDVVRFFGSGSPHVEALRNAAIKRAFDGTIITTKTGLQQRISGASIDKFLSQYTREEQELLFPHGLAQDLRIVADEMKALFPKATDDTGRSIAAQTIKLNVGPNVFSPRTMRADMKWLGTAFEGWLADRPALIRFIADIKRTPGPNEQLARDTIGVLFKSFMQNVGAAEQSTAERPPPRTGTR